MPGTYQYDVEIKSNVAKLLSDMKQVQDRLDTVEGKEYKIKLNVDEKKLSSVISNLEKMLDSLGKGTGDFKQFENLSKELSSIVSEVQSLSKAFGKVDDSGTKTLLSSIQNIDKSLSELSQNILNVNKNMSNMGGKQIENISNAYGDATKNAKKLAEIQNKLSNKSNSSSNNVIGTMLPSDSEFKTVLSNLDTTKSKLGEIVKITEKINSDEKKSYVLRDKNGSTETYNINSKTQKGQIANSSYVQYDVNAITKAKKEELAIEQEITKEHEKQVSTQQKKFQDFQKEQANYEESVNKVNSAIQKTDEILDTLPLHDKLDGQFLDMIDSVDNLNSKLKSGELTLSEYKNEVKSVTSEFSKMVSIQQKRDVEDYNANAKADNAKKLEREKQIWNELTTSLERYSTIQKRIASNNALSTDNEEATKLLEHIHELQRNDILPTEKLTASNEKLQQINQTVADLKAKLKESTLDSVQGSIDKYQKIITHAQTYPSDFHPSTQYNTTLAKLESENEILKNYKASLQGVTELTKDQQATINKLTQNCEKAATEFKKLSAAEKGTVEVGIEKAIQRINKDLAENTKYSAEAKAGLNTLLVQLKSGNPSINLRKITEEIIRIENAEIAAGRAGKSLWDIFKTKSTYGFIGQMQSFLSMYVGFYGMINAAKKVGSTLVELDTALVDLKKTTTMSSSELENFYYDSNDIAKQMGVTTQAIIDQASAWSRLGYSTKEQSETMAKLSSQFASISPGMSTDEAQEGLVSIMKAFDIDPNDVETEIMDKVNVLGNKFAENNQDVVEGLKRSAAAMSAMGQSFTDTAALFTGGMEILQDSESMGTALRTLSMRIRGYDEETNQLSDDLVNVTGEVADLTKTTKNAQGISLFTDASQEHYKSMVQYLGEIADEWDQISEKNQTELLQKLFGKNRANESVCPYVQKCA